MILISQTGSDLIGSKKERFTQTHTLHRYIVVGLLISRKKLEDPL